MSFVAGHKSQSDLFKERNKGLAGYISWVSGINRKWGHWVWCLRDGGQNGRPQAPVPTHHCEPPPRPLSCSQQVQRLERLPLALVSSCCLCRVGEGPRVAPVMRRGVRPLPVTNRTSHGRRYFPHEEPIGKGVHAGCPQTPARSMMSVPGTCLPLSSSGR